MKLDTIRPARLEFNDEGTPVSRDFDDVYFSNDNGLEETRYVFLEGNRLTQRFHEHQRPLMVVAESGFGTGLNFLTLWQAFDTFCAEQPEAILQRLHFISFEKFPLTHDDLARAHARWPELSRYAHALQAQWPLPFGGCHRLLLNEGCVTLDLWFGDIATLTNALDDSLDGKVDAWFLDGFAPAKNPEMWTPALFNAMARLAHADGTLATFTSAGFVRRGLQDAGFAMEKRPGFGRKREMLVGQRAAASAPAPRTPWYARRAATGPRDAAIVGGGVASAMLALTLLRRGWQVTLYCKDTAPAEGASGNRQGALYPLLSQHDAALATFFPAAFTFARRLYDALPIAFDHAWCGVTQLGWDEKSQRKNAQMLERPLPDEIAHAVSAQDTAEQCGVATSCGGVTYPLGGWLCPAELTAAAIDYAVTLGLKVHYGQAVESLASANDGWQLFFVDGHSAVHTAVALANGHEIQHFSQTCDLPVYPVGGQVSHIPTTPGLGALRQVLCYDGYLTPVNPHTQQHCIGASYHRGQTSAVFSPDDQQDNRQRLINCLPEADWARDVNVSANKARCGVRCATRDHLPMVGGVPDYDATLSAYARLIAESDAQAQPPAPVYDNLFMLGALGSRGLCNAPLAAEILAAQMSDEPLPLDAATLAALNPNRLWVRKLLKGKAVKSA